MTINYNINKINRALQDFYNATGIDMDFLQADFTPVGNRRLEHNRYCMEVQSTEQGKHACHLSDRQLLEQCKKSKKTEMSICHAGLVNVAIPLLYDDVIIGYIIFGRMKPDTMLSLPEQYLTTLGLDTQELRKRYTDIPFFESTRIQSVSNIAIMLAKYILLENMLKPHLNECMQSVVTFINNNLEKDLSVKLISRHTNISKSALYKNFHTHFNCTVSEYIHAKRIERSLPLLTETNLSIEEISQRVGFSAASYYSKIFKKQMGVVPVKYRKMQR
ncbi:MAG: helix-turn-helix domain-containing protein [Ruminococcaceae bacterium]|nr:helix-turn-helix domain-containing protein [Oscillospiraceae bacterium]